MGLGQGLLGIVRLFRDGVYGALPAVDNDLCNIVKDGERIGADQQRGDGEQGQKHQEENPGGNMFMDVCPFQHGLYELQSEHPLRFMLDGIIA